jgi:hypothetical protein
MSFGIFTDVLANNFNAHQVNTDGLLLGALTYPSADGTSGQVLTTNGSGTLSLQNTGNVSGPATSTNTAIAVYNGPSGKILQNSVVTVDGTGDITTAGNLSVGNVTSSGMKVGALTYASSDGTSGQVMTTNGSGTLSLQNTGNVSGPASSTNAAVALFSGTTGKTIQNSTVTIDGSGNVSTSGGVTSSTLTVGALSYPSVDGSSGAVLTTNGSGTLSLVTPAAAKSQLFGQVLSQTSNVSALANDHVTFSTVAFSDGSNISLDTTSTYSTTTGTASIGRLTLQAGKTYYIECSIFGFVGTTLSVSLWDASSNVSIASGTIGSTAGNSTGVMSVYAPSSTKLVEVRFTTTLVTSISNAYIKVEEL